MLCRFRFSVILSHLENHLRLRNTLYVIFEKLRKSEILQNIGRGIYFKDHNNMVFFRKNKQKYRRCGFFGIFRAVFMLYIQGGSQPLECGKIPAEIFQKSATFSMTFCKTYKNQWQKFELLKFQRLFEKVKDTCIC